MKYIEANWDAPKNIRAYTTTRHISRPDQAQNNELIHLLALPQEPIWVKQTHSTIAIEAIPHNKGQIADATFTTQVNQVCAILTADCLPVFVCNRTGDFAALIHAGWRGLAAGIIENTLKNYHGDTEDLLIWLGPAIGANKFEVGKDVYDAFTLSHSQSAEAFTAINGNKWMADIYLLAKIRLRLQGVKHIYGESFCTYTQEDLFFSYRRDKNNPGRMASLLWIES